MEEKTKSSTQSSKKVTEKTEEAAVTTKKGKRGLGKFVFLVCIIIAVWFFWNMKEQGMHWGGRNNESDNAPLTTRAVMKKIKSEYQSNPEFQRCFTQTTEACLAQQIDKQMLQEKTIELCDDYITDSQKDACRFGFIASNTKNIADISLCAAIHVEEERSKCRIAVGVKAAAEAQERALCQELPDSQEQEQCYRESTLALVKMSGDDHWCVEVEDGKERRLCEEAIKEYYASHNEEPPVDGLYQSVFTENTVIEEEASGKDTNDASTEDQTEGQSDDPSGQ